MPELRIVDRPPGSQRRADGSLAGGWWHEVQDDRMVCDLCPRACCLKPGDRGFCFVRQNCDGEMVLTTYGKSTGFCIDPIEKKPLNHFFPGTSVLSFGTAGCNLGCKFCQNHDISKAREVELLSEDATPETIARAAVELGCKSVAFTYNDPIIWAEYAIDTAKACRQVGVQSVAVTAGYITPQARAPFFEFFDAANVDLKAFTEDFYHQVTLSHLQPVLDTLQWLKRETDVWFEITNLIIPGANDSRDELQKLCDWVLEHVGDQVPLHFSAFHPDFRMLDHPATPHETLLKAHELATRTGLKYVYVGNVNDPQHQSTYCSKCGKLVIERNWYELGAYHLAGQACAHCGHRLPGRFGQHKGDWGRRRQPIQIGQFAVKNESQGSRDLDGGDMAQTTGPRALARVTAEQESAILNAAGIFVASAVTGQEVALTDPSMAGTAEQLVDGVYISLKRQGRLRGCCGFTGQSMRVIDGMLYSAQQTAREDPRLPPVSPTELPFLDVEIWMLGKQQPVHARGSDRAAEIKVGRDGLMISRGQARGLLLPGVATDHAWDEETFLRQVCLKAKLPPSAWREPDTILQRFEGICVKGTIDQHVLKRISLQPDTVVNDESIELLANFARQNVQLLFSRALPHYYLREVEDGMVNGIVLTATLPAGRQINISRISLRPPMPLQSTLFCLGEDLVRSLQRLQVDPSAAKIDLAILEDPAMHGTTRCPDLRGATPERCLFANGPGEAYAWRLDPSLSPGDNLGQLVNEMQLRDDTAASLFSFATHATSPLSFIKKVQPSLGSSIRLPAVAGKFYPATPKAVASMVRSLVPTEAPPKRAWRAAMVPHAGLRFSGRIAAEVMAQLEFPPSVIVIGPKHTRNGVDWAVAPHETWSLPGMEISNDRQLAQRLVEEIEHLELDAAAHEAEHAIEVELPFLHHFAPRSKVVGIAIGSGSLEACHQFATGLAMVLRDLGDNVLLLISSDMNHFASDAETRRLDELAISALEGLDPESIFKTVRENEISMCGLLPAVITLDALNQIKPLVKAERVSYATSADVTGDTSRVVGYAGMLFA